MYLNHSLSTSEIHTSSTCLQGGFDEEETCVHVICEIQIKHLYAVYLLLRLSVNSDTDMLPARYP